MKETGRQIPWARLATESFVIVASILLAFAIDAWWEGRQAREAQIEQLARVAVEIEANSSAVARKIAVLQKSIDSTSEYLSFTGPDPAPMTIEEYSNMWADILDIGMFSLVRRATEEYLGMGNPTSSSEMDVRDALLTWHAEVSLISEQHALLRSEHAKLVDYTSLQRPAMVTMSAIPVMQKHPESKFDMDPASSLSDPIEEGLLGVYLLRLEFVVTRLNGIQESHELLLNSIRSITDAR